MGKEKIALTICFCLVVALAGFSCWLYVGAKGLESKVGDLQTKTDNLEAENAELSTNVQNLTWTLGNLTSDLNSIGFMGSSSITITATSFCGTSGQSTNYINITLKNTGTKTVTIGQIKVNNVIKTFTATGSNYTLPAGDINHIIKIQNVNWVNGNPYKVDLFDTSGSAVGSTQQNSPGT